MIKNKLNQFVKLIKYPLVICKIVVIIIYSSEKHKEISKMANNKYPNGAYKTTGKKQDKISQEIFEGFFKTGNSATMGMNFDQFSGVCKYNICTSDNHEINYWINIEGKILRVEIVK